METNPRQKIMLLEMADAVLGSWWTVIAGACLGLAAGLVLLDVSPKVYEAGTKIFVAPAKLPQEYVGTTVSDDTEARLRGLRDAVLSRTYLRTILTEQHALPEGDEAQQELLIADLRSRVSVLYTRGSRSFEILILDSDPQRAASLANRLGELYIQENAKARAADAGEATTTLEVLANSVLSQLQAQERRINEYKALHPHDSVAQMSANLQLLNSREKELETNEKAQASVTERLQALRAQVSQEELLQGYTPPVPTPSTAAARPNTKLRALETELDALRLRYSPDHPDVQTKERQIAELKAKAPEEPTKAPQATVAAPTINPWTTKVLALERDLDRLQADEVKLREDIRAYESRIENAPRVQQELEQLSLGLDALRASHNGYQGKIESARGAQQLEEIQKSSQFEIVDRAVAPAFPVSPNPLYAFGLGIVAGLLLFVGPVLSRRLLWPVVASEAGLRAVSAVPILVSIPCLPTPDMLRSGSRRRLRNLAYSVASALVLGITFIALK